MKISPIEIIHKYLVGLAVLLFFGLWMHNLTVNPIDHDEIQPMHVSWLLTQGATPFQDFFDHHPPFAWYILASFVGESVEGWSISSFRVFSSMGLLCLFVLIVVHMRLSFPSLHITWFIPLLLIIFIQPFFLKYLSQFRIDGGSYAILLGAIWLVRVKAFKSIFARFFVYSCITSVSIMFLPKFLFLPVTFGLVALFGLRKDGMQFRSAAAGLLLGGTLIFFLTWGTLPLLGIAPKTYFDFIVRFNARLNGVFQPRWGLWVGLWQHAAFMGIFFGGVVVWAVLVVSRKIKLNDYDVSLLIFLTLQLFMVSVEFLQYVVPWMLMSLHFFAVPMVFLSEKLGKKNYVLASTALLVLAPSLASAILEKDSGAVIKEQIKTIHWMNEVVPKEGTVLAALPMHPIFRKDAVYYWFDVWDRNRPIIHDITPVVPEWEAEFNRVKIMEELEAHQPALIVLTEGPNSPHDDPEKRAALSIYMKKNKNVYDDVRKFGVRALVRR